jgi:polyhydroxyalkanoate synthase
VNRGRDELPIRNLITLMTPCDYAEMGFMSRMFRPGRLDANDVIDDTGLVLAAAMDEGFQSLKPTDQVVQQANLWNDKWLEGLLAMNRWARDQVAFPGAAFRQTVRVLIRENALASGVIPFGRGEVRLRDISCPYLNVFCEQDTIVPAASSEPPVGLVGSKDASELRLQSGHVGLVAGRQAARVARPQIADWIRRPQRGAQPGRRPTPWRAPPRRTSFGGVAESRPIRLPPAHEPASRRGSPRAPGRCSA